MSVESGLFKDGRERSLASRVGRVELVVTIPVGGDDYRLRGGLLDAGWRFSLTRFGDGARVVRDSEDDHQELELDAHQRYEEQEKHRRQDERQEPKRQPLRKASANDADRHQCREDHPSHVEKLDQLLRDEIGEAEIEQ